MRTRLRTGGSGCALLQCLTAIVINSWHICIPTHPFLHYMLIFCSFCSLPSQCQVLDALLRFFPEAGFLLISSAVHCAYISCLLH